MSLSAPVQGVPDVELRQKFESYARTRDPSLRAEIAQAYLPLAALLAARYGRRKGSYEDLQQAANMALVGAIDRFDPGRGSAFSTFAWTTIAGELKHYLRDRSWGLRVPRRVQEQYLVTARAADDLHQERGRAPTVAELSERTGLDHEATIEALEVRSAHQVSSLDAPGQQGEPAAWSSGASDPGFEQAEERDLLRRLLARVSEDERELLRLRFYEQLSQSDIAARIGVSQMHVSRLLGSLLARMRSMATEGARVTA